MNRLRALVRLVAIAVLTFGGFASMTVILPFRRLAPSWHLRLRNATFRIWGRGMAKALGATVEVTGTPPQGAAFLVANHLSYVDIVLLGSFVDAAFVAKSELRSWPVAGTVIASGDTIFIDRNRRRDLVRVIASVDRALDRGLGVVVFAEGTTSKGETIQPLKPSILELAVRAQRPVHYATIHYALTNDAPTQDVVCWWGDAPFGPHLWELVHQPGFTARVHFGDTPLAADDRKSLAGNLHAAMMTHFEPSAPCPE